MTHPPSREVPLAIPADEFRRLGHQLVDRIADLQSTMASRPVTAGEPPSTIRSILGAQPLPEQGAAPDAILDRATDLLIPHSLYNAHPRFWGYITAPPSPIGILGDLLASGLNPNVGAFILGPMATEIEAQTIRWIADLVGYPTNCGGLLVSGGNMANFVGFLAGRYAKAGSSIRVQGLGSRPPLRAYASAATHTWIQKAADLFGLGTRQIRYIPVDDQERMRVDLLESAIAEDRANGDLPFLVVGTAGSVGTGSIDPLPAIAEICRKHDLWFHVDGAYGALAACLPDASADLLGLREADSVALDPHKWLYAPLEAGAVLVRDAATLRDAFSYHPEYYRMDEVGGEAPLNFVEFGLQNSRGFRALKVWLALQQAGRRGYQQMMADDVALARQLFDLAEAHDELEAVMHSLSITCFRFIPKGFDLTAPGAAEYLNTLNAQLVERLQEGGELFVSNAVIAGRYVLRACVVNFNTRAEDIAACPAVVCRIGRELHRATAAS
ncbi:MAG: aspartate aminotransferase family protein [Gemmatimonadota bacterium]